jgi:ABC-2 type transport system ATP-binding protein
MVPVIETRALTKVYAARKPAAPALDRLDLSVERGEIFGFLGPNGAGKSTTINLLMDLIRPTAGSAALFGMDSRQNAVEIHRRVGFLPAELALWKGDTARQIIRSIALVRGDAPAQIKEAERLAERLSFDPTKKMRDFSTGNKRKLGIILALMHRPELLILDEPTSGLDPLLQQTFNQMMLEAKAEGRTVFLSSHVLSEVQAICDRVGILRNGQLKAVESVHTLTRVGLRKVSMQLSSENDTLQTLRALAGVSDLRQHGEQWQFSYAGQPRQLLAALAAADIADVLITEPTLEEIFLTFYGDNGKVN